MKIIVAALLFIIGIGFAANMMGRLTGRYGPVRLWRNALIAGIIAVIAFACAYALIKL
jgi:hypothetical protein